MSKKQVKLGKGAYGQVELKGGKAVKKFKKLSHLVQEWTAGIFLKYEGTEHTIHPLSFDLKSLEITMKAYNTNLRKILDKGISEEDKRLYLKKLLEGLVELQDLNLVHADIKPSNLLVGKGDDKKHLIIGDLGFVSHVGFSKVERTAEAYREKYDMSNGFGHDMYSVGVIMLELFSEDEKCTREKECTKHVKDKVISSLIIRLFHETPDKRPRAREMMKELGYPCNENVRKNKSKIYPTVKELEKEKDFMDGICNSFEIKRKEYGFMALNTYLKEHTEGKDGKDAKGSEGKSEKKDGKDGKGKKDRKKKDKGKKDERKKEKNVKNYIVATVFILSSVFGRSSIDIKSLLEKGKVSERKFMKSLEKLLNSRTFVCNIMEPSI